MKIPGLILFTILLSSPSSPLRSQTASWTGGTSQSWRTATNWSTESVPISTSKVIISVGSFDPYVPAPLGSDTAKTGTLTVQSGANLNFDPQPNRGILIVYGTEQLLNNGIVTLGDGKIIFKNSITFQNGGTFDAGAGSLDFQGLVWNNNSGSSFIPGTSTVTFSGASPETLLGNISFYNVQLGNTGGSVTLNGNITVTNSITLNAGTSVTLTSGSLTIAASATLDLGSGSSLTVNGAFNNNGVVTGSGSLSSNKPLVNSVVATSATAVDITFSEPLDGSSSQTLGNYSITKGVSVASANRDASNHALIHLAVSSLSVDTVYRLTVNNVIDEPGTDTVAANSQKNFQYPDSPALPVQLASFVVSGKSTHAELHWQTTTEINSYGFDVERTDGANLRSAVDWQKIGFVVGAGTTTSTHQYTFVDDNVRPGRYAYRLKRINSDGSFTYSETAEAEVGLAGKEFTLEPNYPNPFNPSTTIRFSLTQDGRATLSIFNILGQVVATLFDDVAPGGRLQEVTFDASRLSSGLYFAKLDAGGQQRMRKMALIK